MQMDKALYDFTKRFLEKQRQGGKLKYSTESAKQLQQRYGFGQVDLAKKWLTFTFNDRIELGKAIKAELAVDILLSDDYPEKQHRNDIAATGRDEKLNSYPVSSDFVLVNSLSALKINLHCYDLSPLTSLGTHLKATEILSVEHKTIVFVENLAVMASLSALNIKSITECFPKEIDLEDALWVYRGDAKKHQQTGTAYQFFRRFSASHQSVCFSDVDPKGIEIALTSHADYWLTVKNIDDFEKITESLKGNEKEWFEQGKAIKFLQKKITEQNGKHQDNLTWQPIFTIASTMQKTLKQEHLVAHNLELTLLDLQTNARNRA